MQVDFAPDESQLRVVEAEPEERLFVTASAGQGKTEVLIARVRELVEYGLNPADEILVLSFSRAAVEAVKKRARAHSLDGLQIRTFDSFAAQILIDADETDNFRGDSFDARIRRANQILSGDDAPSQLSYLKHVLIDEAQDLVGDRAEMVLSLFSCLDDSFGFTVLGDPLQGIYDFQLEESQSNTTSEEFVNTLMNEFDADRLALTHHYRAVTDRTRELIDVGNELRRRGVVAGEAAASAHALLDDFARQCSSSSMLHEGGALSPAEGESTAVLCSTNYEVLIASDLLWENGHPHVVRRRAQEMSVAPWVYGTFRDLEDRTYMADEIKALLEEQFGDDAGERWLALKTAEGDFNSYASLNVPRLSQRLRSRSVPLSLTVEDRSPLTVSTVHRSKGLEFDNVLYVRPQIDSPADKPTFDALKQKYVALSRARAEIIRTKLPKDSLKRADRLSGRWLEKAYGKYGQYTARMEITNSDVDDLTPYYPTDGSDPQSIQDNLKLEELLGVVVSGRIENDAMGTSAAPRYTLETADGRVIGRTSTSFAYALKASYGSWNSRKWQWPAGFTGARVTSIECATGHPEETKVLGLGASGMWLVPRLTGLITRLRD